MLDADLYDCQDCLAARETDGVPSTGEAIDYAIELAFDLADHQTTAETAAAEICRKAKDWRAWKAKEPARRDAAREKQEAAQAALKAAHNKIFWWRIYFSMSSFFALIFLGISMSVR